MLNAKVSASCVAALLVAGGTYWQFPVIKQTAAGYLGQAANPVATFDPKSIVQIAPLTPDGGALRQIYAGARNVPAVREANKDLESSATELGRIERMLGMLHRAVSQSCIIIDGDVGNGVRTISQRAEKFASETIVIERLMKASLDQATKVVQTAALNNKKSYSPNEDMRVQYEFTFEEFRKTATDIRTKSAAITKFITHIDAQTMHCTPPEIPPIIERVASKP